MARFGTWKPLASTWASQQRMTQVDIISIHTMVGSLAGTDGMWRKTGYSGNHSHFGFGADGTCWQWQDTLYRAAANYNGNWHIISAECADVGTGFPAWNINDGSQVPAFTAAQVEALAQFIAAMCKAHNIPCVLIPDSKPGRRGVGYHRLGVPGFVVSGGELWSTVNRKVCPGDRRIAQMPQIIARAQQIVNGDDMPTAKEVADELLNHPIYFRYRNDADPRGYGESSATVIEVLRDTYLQMYWGNGLNLSWGPGVAAQMQELVGRTAPTAGTGTPVTVDAGTLAAALKDPAFLASLAKAVNDDAASRLAS
jgi:hypothetical protein